MNKPYLIASFITALALLLLCTGFTFFLLRYRKEEVKRVEVGENDVLILDALLKEQEQPPKKRVSQIVYKVLSTIYLLLLIPLMTYAFVTRIEGNVPVLGNESALVVASGSMSKKNEENTYLFDQTIDEERRDYQFQTYDIVFLQKPSSPEDIHLYDVIAYQNREKKVTILHRLIAQREDGTYLTRGDANNASDDYHPSYSDIVGVYHGRRLKKIGAFLLFLPSVPGILTGVGILYILVLVDRENQKIEEAKEKRKQYLKEELEKRRKQVKTTPFYLSVKDVVYRIEEDGKGKKEAREDSSLPLIPYLPDEQTKDKGETPHGSK